MNETSESGTRLRFVVSITDVDITTNEEHKTNLRYFDEFSDACKWIKTHASMYSESKFGDKNINRFFRIEKRYYII